MQGDDNNWVNIYEYVMELFIKIIFKRHQYIIEYVFIVTRLIKIRPERWNVKQ